MFPEVFPIIENFTAIDQNVYDLWLRGLSYKDATAELMKSPDVQEFGRDIPPHCDLEKMITMDTLDHYRIFAELEKFLESPKLLAENCMHQISPADQNMLIEKYYALDDVVVREIISKKLSGRSRKDLDDVEEKTRVLLRSCRRQFDNIKRVYKLIDDVSGGSLLATVRSQFLLPENLSRRYAAIVFLLHAKFETSKRRLNFVTFEDLYVCAFSMMEHWCGEAPADDCGIDRDFLYQLRDLKCLLDREKEHKNLVQAELRKSGECPVAEAEQSFKLLSRPLITIATALHTPKELRDLLVDIVERVIEPTRTLRWSTAQVSGFLDAFTRTGGALLQGTPHCSVWDRYMSVIRTCVVQLHHL